MTPNSCTVKLTRELAGGQQITLQTEVIKNANPQEIGEALQWLTQQFVQLQNSPTYLAIAAAQPQPNPNFQPSTQQTSQRAG